MLVRTRQRSTNRRGGTLPLAVSACLALAACGGGSAPVPLRGSVTGLSGTGLVLQSSLGEELVVAGNGPFLFSTPATAGASISMAVVHQPVSPWQECSILGSPALASPSLELQVTCSTRTLAVGGSVAGLGGTGVGLRGSFGGEAPVDHDVTADGPFLFPGRIASGTRYAVTVRAQPAGRVCSVSGGSGTVADADVVGISVVCS